MKGGPRRRVVGGPHPADDLERLVEQLVALLEVDAQGPVLGPLVPGGGGQDEAALGEHVDRGHRLRHQERVPVREHHDVRDQLQPGGQRGDEGQRGERVESIVTAGLEPLVRRRRVVGEADPVEADRLGGAGEPAERILRHEGGIVGMRDQRVGHPVLHVRRPPVSGAPIMADALRRRRIYVTFRIRIMATPPQTALPAPSAGAGRPRDPRINEAVLRATAELLEEVGYLQLTIGAIAERADTNKPAIYRRWPTKAHLVYEAVFPVARTRTWIPPGDDLRGDIRSLVAVGVELLGRPAARAALPGLMAESASDPTLQVDVLERFAGGTWGWMQQRIEQAKEAGEVRADVHPSTVLELSPARRSSPRPSARSRRSTRPGSTG